MNENIVCYAEDCIYHDNEKNICMSSDGIELGGSGECLTYSEEEQSNEKQRL